MHHLQLLYLQDLGLQPNKSFTKAQIFSGSSQEEAGKGNGHHTQNLAEIISSHDTNTHTRPACLSTAPSTLSLITPGEGGSQEDGWEGVLTEGEQ